ncbi:MAG: hypothetical protein ABIB46_06250 [bacterium]
MNIKEMNKVQNDIEKIMDDERENIPINWQNDLHRTIVIISNIKSRHRK